MKTLTIFLICFTMISIDIVYSQPDLILGNQVSGQRFLLHTRPQQFGDFFQLTGDNIFGDWMWDQGITFQRNTGNVGIGTTNPTGKFTVRGGVHLQETSDANLRLSMGYYKDAFVEYGFLNSLDWGGLNGKNLVLNSRASNEAWGNVGIGPLVPIQALDIGGRLNIRKGVIQNGTEPITSTEDLGLYSQREGFHMRFVTKNTPIRFFTDGSNANNFIGSNSKLNINNNGNIGINTDDPIAPLTVNGPANGTAIQLGMNTNTNENYHIVSHNGYLQFFNGNHLVNGYRLMTIRSNGNVGIGVATYDSDSKLAVDGTIKAKEVIVSLNTNDWQDWPDYVFKDNYKLMPLDEVERFVKENSHLPEVESAEELEENGLNLGEMQKKLLKKVEEITLYLIELKKENEKLKSEVEYLLKK